MREVRLNVTLGLDGFSGGRSLDRFRGTREKSLGLGLNVCRPGLVTLRSTDFDIERCKSGFGRH